MQITNEINTERMYDNVMNKFKWGGVDKKGVYLDGEIKAIETVLNYVATLERKINEMDRWIHVEKRLPDDEAENFIQEELNGVGYLYPCLLAYRSPHTERIHVVRFYYDIHEKWFVNAGEKLCEKDRCIAWQPLPELPKEGKNRCKSATMLQLQFFCSITCSMQNTLTITG